MQRRGSLVHPPHREQRERAGRGQVCRCRCRPAAPHLLGQRRCTLLRLSAAHTGNQPPAAARMVSASPSTLWGRVGPAQPSPAQPSPAQPQRSLEAHATSKQMGLHRDSSSRSRGRPPAVLGSHVDRCQQAARQLSGALRRPPGGILPHPHRICQHLLVPGLQGAARDGPSLGQNHCARVLFAFLPFASTNGLQDSPLAQGERLQAAAMTGR